MSPAPAQVALEICEIARGELAKLIPAARNGLLTLSAGDEAEEIKNTITRPLSDALATLIDWAGASSDPLHPSRNGIRTASFVRETLLSTLWTELGNEITYLHTHADSHLATTTLDNAPAWYMALQGVFPDDGSPPAYGAVLQAVLVASATVHAISD
jgi:hypothetical protein